MARSKVYSTLAGHIHDARCHFNTVMTLEAQRDQALYEAIAECALGIRLAIKHPKVWDDEISQEYGWSGMRSISTQFLAVAASTDEGELSSDSKLSKDRRATYANAAMWLIDVHRLKDGADGAAALREVGGVEKAAAQWKMVSPQGRRVPRSPDTLVWVVWQDLQNYKVFVDEGMAFAEGYALDENNIDYDITEEPAGNFELSGFGFTVTEDGEVSGSHRQDAPNVPHRVKDAKPGTGLETTRETPLAPGIWEEPETARAAPAPPPDEPAPPSQASTPEPPSPKVTEQAARAQQPSARAQQPDEPPLATECFTLMSAWLASNPSAADIHEVMSLIRQKMGAEPPRPSEQPGVTVH